VNSTKLSAFCDKVLEIGWLLALIITPLFFNVYSSRVFEPDKLTTLRTVALIMAAVWGVKTIEERVSGQHESELTWRTPLVFPTLFVVAVYLLSTLLSVTPRVSLLGSYQRLQGTYTTLAYIVVFLIILQRLRTRAQLDRLIEFAEERIFAEAPNAFILVSSFNERVLKLYRRLGYEIVGELREYIIPGHSEILLRKTIAPLSEFGKEP